MCGGQNINDWTLSPGLVNQVASTDCVRIEPDEGGGWSEDAGLPEGRTMGNFILLPDGKILLTNGAQQGGFFVFIFHFWTEVNSILTSLFFLFVGTAGYGSASYLVGNSFAKNPILTPV